MVMFWKEALDSTYKFAFLLFCIEICHFIETARVAFIQIEIIDYSCILVKKNFK